MQCLTSSRVTISSPRGRPNIEKRLGDCSSSGPPPRPRAPSSPPGPTGLLRDRLLELGTRRVGVVLAPAGHGKTTLLGHVAARFDGDVAWYRLDAADRRADRLAAGIARTLLRPLGLDGPREAARVAGRRRGLPRPADEPGAGRPRRPVLLVLDDFHEVAGGEAERDVARFVSHAPAELHVAARRAAGSPGSTSIELRMSGSARRARGGGPAVPVVGGRAAVPGRLPVAAGPEDAAALTRRTDGWAAGLAMFHLLTSGRPAGAAPAGHRRTCPAGRGWCAPTWSARCSATCPPSCATSCAGRARSASSPARCATRCSAAPAARTCSRSLKQRRLFTTTEDDGRRFRYHQVLLDHLELELTDHLGADESRAWYARAAGAAARRPAR